LSKFILVKLKSKQGGEKILLAAGKAVDPFWAIFSIHGTESTKALIENYRIGDLLPLEADDTAKDQPSSTGLEALFSNEPVRDPSLIVHSTRPCNAESAMSSLESFITPNDKFYVRNHLPVPDIDPNTFKLEIEG
jgi:sulfite oxidase